MADLIDAIGKLEAALKANNNDEAGKIMQTLGGMQKEGHHDFRVKEQH
jgi:cytochrome c556